MTTSRELIEGKDEHGNFALFVAVGAPGSYTLYRARLDYVDTFKRKWQAVKLAKFGSLDD